METDAVYLRVTQKDYERLVKLIERDERVRSYNRKKQAEKRGPGAISHTYVKMIDLNVLNLPSEVIEILRDYDQVDEEPQLDNLDEQA